MDYIICARSIKKGKFRNEPGKSKFLFVPDDQLPLPGQAVSRKNFFDQAIKEAAGGHDVNSDDTGDILVFIHGYNNSQEIVMERHRLLKNNLYQKGFKGLLLSFDWPSANHPLNYLEDRSDAKQTALQLVTDCIFAFSRYQQQTCTINVHLLAHSTGAFVIREAFDDADDRPGIASINWTVSQIAFIGADISSGSMSRNNSKSKSIFRHCIRLTNYSNPYDKILKLSNVKRIGVAPRVGRTGLPDDHPDNCLNLNCGNYFKTIESKSSESAFCHSWHFGDDLFISDLVMTLKGDIGRDSFPTRKPDRKGNFHLISV